MTQETYTDAELIHWLRCGDSKAQQAAERFERALKRLEEGE